MTTTSTQAISNRKSDVQIPNSDPPWVRRLIAYAGRYRRNLALAFGASAVGMLIMAMIPLIQRAVVDDAILSDRTPLAPLAAILIGAAVLSFGAAFVRRYIGGQLALDIQHDLRTDVFNSLSRLDGARQDELQTGQVISRNTSDIAMVHGLLSMLPLLTGQALLFVVSLVVMLVLSPLLTLVALAVGPGLLWISYLSRKRLFPATWEAQQQAAAVASVVDNAVTGVRVVKGFGQEEQELTKLESSGKSLFASRLRSIRLTSRYNPALQAIPALGQIGVLALGGWLAIKGQITLGTFLAFSSYLAQLIGPVRMLSALLTMGQQARASVIRILEIIDARPVVTEKPDARGLTPTTAPGIEFENVTFGYRPSHPVLKDLTLSVRPGETLAIVGVSGSGKSTIAALLPRFYDPQSGVLRIDGKDVRQVTFESLRTTIGLVSEDSFLFSDTVGANIAYGHPQAKIEQIMAAAQAAGADEFIRALPDGYDTQIGERGLTLSGGQRQRLSLARALLADPRILVLDDATSAVDARVEAQIHAALYRVTRERTTLIIAHRRSTLALADRIAVLDHGRIIDVGTHDELVGRCSQYRLLLSGIADGEQQSANVETLAGITPALWPAHTPEAVSVQGVGSGGGMGGALASAPPTPELLAKVAALPPATDTPNVSRQLSRAAEPRFTLRRLLRPLAIPLFIGLALVAVDAFASLIIPVLIRSGIDDGIHREALGVIGAMALLGLGVVALNWASGVAQTRVTGRTGERLLYTLRVKTFAHLQRLGLDYYEREMSGRIMTRMTTDIDALSTFLQTGLATAAVSLLSFVGISVALLVIDWQLALVVMATLPVLVLATIVFRAKSSKAYTQAREAVSTVNADLQENVAGMRITQAFRREEHNRRRFSGRSNTYRNLRLRAQRYIATYFPFVEFLSTIAAALVLIVGANFVHNGAITAGALIAYLLYIELFFSPIQQLSQVFDGYQQAVVGLRRIKELLRTSTNTPLAKKPADVKHLAGEIVFDHTHFSYGTDNAEALNDINFTVSPGETVALVGQTGAGKSTLVKLVSRFYDVTAGRILVDGVDVRDYDLVAYRHRLGVVPQEPYLFPGTIADNIAYGRPDSTPVDIETAARTVGAHEMIAGLEQGYRHQIAERGRNLSTGQRQLVALARAQLVDPDILIMDEATASLDLATEAAVLRASQRLAGKRTTLVVAHRLTTASHADRIVVMDSGQIAETGTHDELLLRGGLYAQLWDTFMSGQTSDATSATRVPELPAPNVFLDSVGDVRA